MIDPVETLISEISGVGSVVDVNVAVASRKREQTVVAEIEKITFSIFCSIDILKKTENAHYKNHIIKARSFLI